MRKSFDGEITSKISSKTLNHDWMTSRSTKMLTDPESDEAGDLSEIHIN